MFIKSQNFKNILFSLEWKAFYHVVGRLYRTILVILFFTCSWLSMIIPALLAVTVIQQHTFKSTYFIDSFSSDAPAFFFFFISDWIVSHL